MAPLARLGIGAAVGILAAQLSLPLLDRAFLLNPNVLAERFAPERRLERRDGVAHFNYGEAGVQANPFFIGFVAWRKDIPSGDVQSVLAAADWMLANNHQTGPGRSVTYDFNPRGWELEPPWQGGLANGACLAALAVAEEERGGGEYQALAKDMVTALGTPMEQGGLARPMPNGIWLEEYAAPNATHAWVLNGHLFALNGLADYAEATGDEEAASLAALAAEGVEEKIDEYVSGHHMLYDLRGRHPSSNRYVAVTVGEIDRTLARYDLPKLRRHRNHWWPPMLGTRLMRWRGMTQVAHIVWLGGWLLVTMGSAALVGRKRGKKAAYKKRNAPVD